MEVGRSEFEVGPSKSTRLSEKQAESERPQMVE
jgi:hypothetical protein